MRAALEAMYATIGYIVPEYYKFPGYLSPSLGLKFSDVPNGLAALSKCRPYQEDARDRQKMMTFMLHLRDFACRKSSCISYMSWIMCKMPGPDDDVHVSGW